MQKKKLPGRTIIIGIAIAVSIVLYFAGVYSGLYASKIIRERTQNDLRLMRNETKEDIIGFKNETKEDINNFRNQTREDISSIKATTKDELAAMNDYVSFLEENLKSMQFEQLFVDTLDHDHMCRFLTITMNNLFDEFVYYWDRLPPRIEEYEKYHILTNDYVQLKKQYNQLSIRTWLVARDKINKCQGDEINILYLYSAGCEDCIEQGEVLDQLRMEALDKGEDIYLFVVDMDSNITIIDNVKQYYRIHEAPVLIVKDNVYQGRVYSLDELRTIVWKR